MSSTRKSSINREKKKISSVLILASLAVFALGYYILEVISRKFDIYLGNTFYVILGCSLMAVSGVFMIFIIKKTFFQKKKKKIKQVHLKDYTNENKS